MHTDVTEAGRVADALAFLREKATPHDLANLARFGIGATRPLGVSMANIQAGARRVGHGHGLALALWDTGVYEARLLASLVDEPSEVTVAQMDRWCRDFDNWGICDTVCFKLFDRSPHAAGRVPKWAARKGEFQKRAGFALLACLALHDKAAPDATFLAGLGLIERGAADDRNFVKKAVSWALRSIGRRNPKLRTASRAVAARLAASDDPAARWVGKDALREFARV